LMVSYAQFQLFSDCFFTMNITEIDFLD